MRNLILFLFLAMFFISFASADAGLLGYFKLNQDVQILQAGDNGTGLFQYCNITSVRAPNSSAFVTNIPMNNNNGEFSYLLLGNNTQDAGEYTVSGVCGFPNEGWSYNFFVNAVGTELTTSQATVYFLVFIIAMMFFVVSIIGGVWLPSDNRKDMAGYILAVENLKYLKMFSWAVAYLSFMLMMYFAYILSFAYLNFDFLGSLFRFAFYAMLAGLLPLFLISVYIIFANLVRDSKIQNALNGGQRIKHE